MLLSLPEILHLVALCDIKHFSPVELVRALVPLDLVEALPLEVVVAGEVHGVPRHRHLGHVQRPDLHSGAS